VSCLEKEASLVDTLSLDDWSYRCRTGAICRPNCNRIHICPREAQHSCHAVICRTFLMTLVNRPVALISRNTISINDPTLTLSIEIRTAIKVLSLDDYF
jgi:hypothetical protein